MALQERWQQVSYQQHPINYYKLRSKFLWMTSSQAWSSPSSHPGGNHTAEPPCAVSQQCLYLCQISFFPYILPLNHAEVPRWIFPLDYKFLEGWNSTLFISNSSEPITISLLAQNRVNEWTNKRYLPTGTPQRKAIWRMIKRCFFLRSPPWARHCIRKSVKKHKTKQKTKQKTLNKSIC